MSPYRVVEDFENALCDYTGAEYAVAVNSCSMALQLALEWHLFTSRLLHGDPVSIPRRTYISVPCAIEHAGLEVAFDDRTWRGAYQLEPVEVWDCARRLTSGMYVPGQYQCVSFAAAKILGIEQGGAILHDNPKADTWLRMMRFDGRMPGYLPQDQPRWTVVGHHCPMLPSIAAQGLLRLHHLPRHNEDMPDYPYPDLSEIGLWD